MDDRMFLGVLAYLVISSLVVANMPASVFLDTSYTAVDPDNLDDPEDSDLSGDISSLTKIARFLFQTWDIDGIPTWAALILTLVNLFSGVITVIYVYDKVRGI